MRALLTIDLKDGNKIEVESKPSGNLVFCEADATVYQEDTLYITHKSGKGDELVVVLETNTAVPRLLVYQLADTHPSQIIPLAFGAKTEKLQVKIRKLPGSSDIILGKTLVEITEKCGSNQAYLLPNSTVEQLLGCDTNAYYTAEKDDTGNLHNLSRIGAQGW